MIEWRPVVGYEALYSVSNTGEVFSQPKFCAFGISATYCGNICARRMWKHVASE
jgi:hypothetical protein